jgi:hypothetical protein
MLSWSNQPAMLPCFTGIMCDTPRVNKEFVQFLLIPIIAMVNYFISLLKQVVVFSGFRNYKNLSRINPEVISIGVGSSTYFHPVGGGAPYIFTSLIQVSSCYLEGPKILPSGRTQKLVEGACIEGEYERLVGCIGQIIRLREFKGQIAGGNISFTTAFAQANNGMLFLCHLYMFVLLY